MTPFFSEISITIFFLTLILLHIVKKNRNAAELYALQSALIGIILLISSFATGSLILFFVALLTIATKAIFAPVTILRLIQKNRLTFSVSSYINTPLTLILLATITAIAHSSFFSPITTLLPENKQILSLAFSATLISLFLIINKKGALSQIIGILSLENSIVFFALFANLEQSPGLQIGIVFDIITLLVISTVVMSMLYKHFGSLDVTDMQHLRD